MTTLRPNAPSAQEARSSGAGFEQLSRLDLFLNSRILTAQTEEKTRRWWRLKVRAKRHLDALPDERIEAYAARLVRLLGEAA